MGERHWTPLHIKLMLHYFCVCEPWERQSKAATEYTASLVRQGLIVPDDGASGYKATPLGAALVDMWCSQPIPVAIYVDPRLSPKEPQ